MALSLVPAFRSPAPFACLRPATATAITTSPAVSRPSPPPPFLRQGIAAEPGALCSNALQCQHFQECSGCTHETELDFPPSLPEAKEFFNRHGVSDLSFDSGFLWGWRCRAKLAVRGSAKEPMVGLYEEGTHNVVDIPFCRAHHPSINAAVELLKQGITLFNVQPYDEDCGTGELRYVQMVVTTYDTSVAASERYLKGKVQISLVWNSRSEKSPGVEKADALSGFLWRRGGQNSSYHLIHSVWINFQTSSTNVIFGNRWRHMIGERDLWERVGGIDISLAPSSFGQANTKAFDSLLHKLQNYVPFGGNVVDLYAGAGIIGLSLAVTRRCRSVKCLEVNKEAKLSFERSLSRLPQSFSGSISWHHTDVATEPLYWLEGSDVVVVDPPRKGLHPALMEALLRLPSLSKKSVQMTESCASKREEKRPWVLQAREACAELQNGSIDKGQSWPHTLIYISCGWESFKKDCQSLVSSKIWRLEKAHAFNFFPGTKSIEILAVFKWGGLSSQREKKKKKAGKRKGSSKTKKIPGKFLSGI